MLNFYDIAYGSFLGATAPYWLINPKHAANSYAPFASGWATCPPAPAHFPRCSSTRSASARSTRHLLSSSGLQQARPELQVIVSVTTDTGYERGKQLYGLTPNVSLVRFPLDFTSAVVRLLNAVRPSLVVLMELELWPNFLRQCAKRHIPVVLVNGRMTSPAFKKYPSGEARHRRDVAAIGGGVRAGRGLRGPLSSGLALEPGNGHRQR